MQVRQILNYCGKICMVMLTVPCILAQDQRVADSLTKIYKTENLEGIEKLELLRNLSFNEMNDLDLSLQYAEELIELSKIAKNDTYLFRGYLQKGNKHRLTGNMEIAIKAFFECAEVAQRAGYTVGVGVANMSVADVYSIMGNPNNAEIYYNKAIEILRGTNDSVSLGSALYNAGDGYYKNQKYDEALRYFEESGRIFTNVNYKIGSAYNMGSIGMLYAKLGKDQLAEAQINEAISILEELQDYYGISAYLTDMSDIYAKKADMTKALAYAQRSLHLAKLQGLKEQISLANLKMTELFETGGNIDSAYRHYKDHIAYRDSVTNLKAVQQMFNLRTDYEISRKQAEVDLLNQQKRNQLLILGLVSVLLITLLWHYHTIRKEKKRSDRLLKNILPEEMAQELKENGKVLAKRFDSVSVLFTDFEGFTMHSEHLSPEALVASVDFYFSRFDQIIEKYQLEKIKTIGDSYMCAGGLPFPSKDHPYKIVQAAFEILEFVQAAKTIDSENLNRFDIRIGINTGPVVAGVVGTKKFSYDIWGDTVNVASRMESNSKPGKINISDNTYAHVKDEFDCEYRGQIAVKNKGIMKMYYVKGISSEATRQDGNLIA